MTPSYFEQLRHRTVLTIVILSQSLIAIADAEVRGFHLIVLGSSISGFVIPDRIRLAIPDFLWNGLVVVLLGGAVLWIRQDITRIFEVLLYFLEILLIVKTYSRRGSRDYWQIMLACYFILLGGVLALASVWIVPILLTFTSFLCFAMVADTVLEPATDHARFGQPIIAEAGWRFADLKWTVAAVVILCALVSMLNFIVVPRLSKAMFDLGFMRSGGGTRTGLSGQVDLGNRGAISLDPTIIGRVRFDGQMSEHLLRLYVVGKRLDRFDGVRWTSADNRLERVHITRTKVHWIRPNTPNTQATRYDLLLKPIGQAFLPHLEQTVAIRFAEQLTLDVSIPEENLLLSEIPLAPIRYEGWVTRNVPSALESSMDLARLTEVPSTLDLKIRSLAKQLAGSELNTPKIMERISTFFTEGFSYSLERDLTGNNVIERFLFDSRAGHCEYFASAAAILARLNGIPARVVTGYLITEKAPPSDWLIRQQNAHAWVEYFDPSEGWARFDPSPRDPETERLIVTDWRRRLLDWMGRTELWWYDTVIDFDLRDQFEMITQLIDLFDSKSTSQINSVGAGTNQKDTRQALPTLKLKEFSKYLAAAIATFILFGYLSTLLRARYLNSKSHPATLEFLRITQSFRKRGPPAPGEDVTIWIDRVIQPQNAGKAQLWLQLYLEMRFNPEENHERNEVFRKLQSLTRELIGKETNQH